MTHQRGSSRLRSFVSAVLVIVGVLALPLGLVANWAQNTLVSTDGFVTTLAPLAQDPAVHTLIVQQGSKAILDRTDLSQVDPDATHQLNSSGLPATIRDALQAQLAQSILNAQNLLTSQLTALTSSPDFDAVWRQVLTSSHEQAIRTLDGEQLPAGKQASNGAFGVQVAPIAVALKARVAAQNPILGALVPTISYTVAVTPAHTVDSLRPGYRLIRVLSPWALFAALACLALGLLLARHRARTLVVMAVVLLILTGFVTLAPGAVAWVFAGAPGESMVLIVLDTVSTSIRAAMIPWLIGMGAALVVGIVAAIIARRRQAA
ncbi:MAG: hypothetical protein ABF811_01585 [Pseudoclavibacter sp.]|jgi:hypothetical protein